jgi:hypothetical protein
MEYERETAEMPNLKASARPAQATMSTAHASPWCHGQPQAHASARPDRDTGGGHTMIWFSNPRHRPLQAPAHHMRYKAFLAQWRIMKAYTGLSAASLTGHRSRRGGRAAVW